MESKESYVHFYAKETLKEWLTKTWTYNRDHGYPNVLSHLSWEGTSAGVYLEYPLYTRTLTSGKIELLGLHSAWTEYPTEEQIKRGNLKLQCSIDVVVCHNNVPKYGFEIVHRHLCTQKKREFFAGHPDFEVYEVSATWILEQTRGHVPKIWNLFRV